MEDRSWAEGMDQETFNKEWTMKYPTRDVIPDVKYYLANHQKEDRSMTPVLPEQIGDDFMEMQGVKEKEKDPKEDLTCPGCGYVAKEIRFESGKLNRIGIRSHMRKCKVLIEKED
jgi:hypothetical protein